MSIGPTGILTPDQSRNQAAAYNNQQSRVQEYSHNVELGPENPNANKKSVSMSKSIINISYLTFGIVGIIGSFWDRFDMAKFTDFLSTFAMIWAPLVVAVGGGRAFKNYVNKKYWNENGQAAPQSGNSPSNYPSNHPSNYPPV